VQALVSPDEYAVLAGRTTDWTALPTSRMPLAPERCAPLAAVAELLGKNEDECARLLDWEGKKALRRAPRSACRPGRDEKVLVSWNALMIAGMARAARCSAATTWLASAKRALGFIRATM